MCLLSVHIDEVVYLKVRSTVTPNASLRNQGNNPIYVFFHIFFLYAHFYSLNFNAFSPNIQIQVRTNMMLGKKMKVQNSFSTHSWLFQIRKNSP